MVYYGFLIKSRLTAIWKGGEKKACKNEQNLNECLLLPSCLYIWVFFLVKVHLGLKLEIMTSSGTVQELIRNQEFRVGWCRGIWVVLKRLQLQTMLLSIRGELQPPSFWYSSSLVSVIRFFGYSFGGLYCQSHSQEPG